MNNLNKNNELKAKDCMSLNAPTTSADSSVSKVASDMVKNSVDIVYVTNKDRKLIGAVTVKQLVSKVVAKALNPKSLKTGMLMKFFPMSVSAEEPLSSIKKLFREFNLKYLPVEKNGKLVGMLSKDDISNKVHA